MVKTMLRHNKVLMGAAIAALFILWLFFSSAQEQVAQERESRTSVGSSTSVTAPGLGTSPDSGDLSASETLVSEAIDPDKPSELISIGEYIDPDRGADLSQPIATIEIGEYIDPDRGADYSEPSNAIEIGEYIDPDRGAVLEVNPLEVLSIGAFIDPDSLSVTNSQEAVEVGEYVDPDRD